MKMPKSKRGMTTAPAELLWDEDEPAPAVGDEVTVPVPSEPAWLRSELQVPVADAAAWVWAAPLKLHALSALF